MSKKNDIPLIMKIIGLKIVAVRGLDINPKANKTKKKNVQFGPCFVLLDDRKTYIEFEEQDCWSYHDCDESARNIKIRQNKEKWEYIMNDLCYYPEANIDI